MRQLPLELRENGSNWAQLLDLALPALDYALKDRPATLANTLQKPGWTLGGGTALALRINHRISDDIDIFVAGLPLRLLVPANNPFAMAISARPDWPGHYLKFHRAEGEIDFLSAPLQTEPGFTLENFRGRSVALETVEEVIVKKIRYRAAQFTPRDAFDLACCARVQPGLAAMIAREADDALPRLRQGLGLLAGRNREAIFSQIRATAGFSGLVAEVLCLAEAVVADAMEMVAKR